jgi:hypothetical protein
MKVFHDGELREVIETTLAKKTLTKKAVATAYGKTYEHKVTLTLKTTNLKDYKFNHKWILDIEDTPGHWYLSTLLETPSRLTGPESRLAIDFGQGWYCENIGALLREAVTLI